MSNFLEQKWHSIHNRLKKGTHILCNDLRKLRCETMRIVSLHNRRAHGVSKRQPITFLNVGNKRVLKDDTTFWMSEHLLLCCCSTTGTKRGWMSVRRVQNIPQSHTPFLQGLRPKLYTLIVCSNTNLVIHMWSFVLP